MLRAFFPNEGEPQKESNIQKLMGELKNYWIQLSDPLDEKILDIFDKICVEIQDTRQDLKHKYSIMIGIVSADDAPILIDDLIQACNQGPIVIKFMIKISITSYTAAKSRTATIAIEQIATTATDMRDLNQELLTQQEYYLESIRHHTLAWNSMNNSISKFMGEVDQRLLAMSQPGKFTFRKETASTSLSSKGSPEFAVGGSLDLVPGCKTRSKTKEDDTGQIQEASAKRIILKESKKQQENLKNILLYTNASLIRHKDSDGYVCNFCPKKFPEPKNLKTHFSEEHDDVQILKLPKSFQYLLKLDVTDLTCKICKKIFDNLNVITTHLQEEHKKIMYTDISSQLIPFKFDSDVLRCAVCTTEFSNFKILQEHMHVHFRNFICDICNAGFVTKRLLVGHRRRHTEGSHKCGHCEKVFTCDQKRRDHEQRIHLGLKKKNKCKFCDEKFADYWTKIDHMVKKHGLPPVVLNCQACERSFVTKRALTRHVKKDHLMERKHVCSICDMRFFLKHRLKDHMMVHSGAKTFQCHACSRWYASKKSLRQHLRSHADDRRFACNVCGQAFVQHCTLKSHVRAKHSA